VLGECMAELKQRGLPFDENIEVGAMIEIPSAAATIDLLANDCRFFSIGTNDLIQYLLAIDRVNDRIAHLYEPTHPAVIRTLKAIVDEAHRHKILVSVCGEMAGDPVYAPLLLGLGMDTLSMSPAWLPSVKYLVRSMTMADARALADEALRMGSPKEIYAKCDAFYRERVKVE
jgi:phosphoenolpyruvate-protein phosphotransferase (PTS system enzyme I)